MAAFLSQFPPVLQALFATIFTWAVTALGAAFVFVNKTLSHKLVDLMLGFAAGVMIAASFFSLLLPSIDMAQSAGLPGWLPAVVGFLFGGAFLYAIDKILPHLHPGLATDQVRALKRTGSARCCSCSPSRCIIFLRVWRWAWLLAQSQRGSLLPA
jgi:ZIP family zinc transporter